METPARKSRTFPVVAVILLVACCVAIWFFIRQRDQERRRAAIAVAEAQIELKNRGIGFLENGEYEKAASAFTLLIEQLPDEKLGRRNLAIARLLKIEEMSGAEQTPQQIQAAIDDATRAVEDLLLHQPDSPSTYVIAADLANRTKDENRYEDMLLAAVKLAPDDASIQFKLFTALQYATEEVKQKRAQNALRAASELAPNNIFVLPQWLSAQAAAKDPGIVDTLKLAREILKPFSAGIELRVRFNVLEAIDKATAGAESGDWAVVVRNTAGLGNVVKPEAMSQIDRRRINSHLLEYVLFDFNDAFYAATYLYQPSAPSLLYVEFIHNPDEQFPYIEDVRDLQLADFDLDGDLELIVLSDAAVSVWERAAKTSQWKQTVALELPAGMRGVVAADLDRDYKETPARAKNDIRPCLDADVDLVVYGDAGALVLQNKLNTETGKRTLERVPQDDAFREVKQILTAALADIDHDGDLDLILSGESGVSIWSNRGDFTYADISGRSALPPTEVRPTKIIPVDWNRDIAIDLVVVDAKSGKAGYLENQMHGRLRWREFDARFNLPEEIKSIAVAELDGNASWDLITVGAQGIHSTLTATPSNGIVALRDTVTGLENPDTHLFDHVLTWDYDNDGYRDPLLWNEGTVKLFSGMPDGSFLRIAAALDVAEKQITDCEVGDIDGDGDLDLLVASATGVAIYRNDGGNANGWIDVSLSADPDKKPSDASKRVNMHGVGSLLELKAGSIYQAQVVTGKTTHFGLGSIEQADVLRILWTNGIPENRVDPTRNMAICAKQDLKGSCPYLYTWDGERYSFMTDLLWSSPIGLQFAEGVIAPAREWEYLKIPGDRLRAIDGEYRLQITEELWEAAYFDRVQLIAVDHPAGFDIYTNEKVGPAEIATHKIHTVREMLIPVAARDKHGRDVLPQIAALDDTYLKAFDGRILQGLTDEYFVELDLGKLQNSKRIMLFLTGWVFPTDTSLNVAISQNPKIDPPKPPSIQVPDGKGGWKVAIPYTGFPGGKTKTIAIDISEIFSENDYRLRLVTSMQLCWDQIFFTVDEEPAQVETTELQLTAADLHYRGFNRRVEHAGFGPESYDYSQVDTDPKWPPMAGHFTRYGNVAPLLRSEDDQLVVMASGDEMTLRFRVPPKSLPPGWQRDFILYNVGWDKDADLNTVYGQTVEPLPFRAMRRYPFPVDQTVPHSPAYVEYLRRYQTREQNGGRFWKALAK